MKLLGFLLLLILQVALWREGAGGGKEGGREEGNEFTFQFLV